MISSDGTNVGKLSEVLETNFFSGKHSIGRWRTFYVWTFVLEIILLVAVVLFVYNLYLTITTFV